MFDQETSSLPPFYRRLAMRASIGMAPVLPLTAWWGSRHFAPLPGWLADHLSNSIISLPIAVVTGVGVSLAAMRSERLRHSAVRVACVAGFIAAGASLATTIPLETEFGYSHVGAPMEGAIPGLIDSAEKNNVDPIDGITAVTVAAAGSVLVARRPRPEDTQPGR